MTNKSTSIIPTEGIERKIYTVRGLRVMLDSDLAGLYGVTTTRLNEQVTRNKRRFSDTFMFQLTQEEKDEVIAKCDNPDKIRFSPALPRVFTERGVLMVANVLKSDRAIEVSVQVIEAFIRLKQAILTNEAIMKKIEEIESRLSGHDDQFKIFQEMILPLLNYQAATKKKIGFNQDGDK